MSDTPQQPGAQQWQPPSPQPPAPPRLPPPVQRRMSRRGQIILFSVLAVVLVGIIGGAWYGTRNAASSADVGDCLQQTGTDEVEVIDCTDPAAEFKVVGRLEERTQVEASLSACSDFDNVENAYWQGEQGEKGFVLCLAPVTP